jgi:hypothetical protein
MKNFRGKFLFIYFLENTLGLGGGGGGKGLHPCLWGLRDTSVNGITFIFHIFISLTCIFLNLLNNFYCFFFEWNQAHFINRQFKYFAQQR